MKPAYAPNLRDLNKGNYTLANRLLKEVRWDAADSKSVEELWRSFKTSLEDICAKTIPMKKSGRKKSLFINKNALKMKQKKRQILQSI